MFDADSAVVVIDFDSCLKVDEKFRMKSGTHGWMRGEELGISAEHQVSEYSNDFYSLDIIRKYLLQHSSESPTEDDMRPLREG